MGAIVYSVIDKKSLGGSYYGMAITSAAASIYSLHYVATVCFDCHIVGAPVYSVPGLKALMGSYYVAITSVATSIESIDYVAIKWFDRHIVGATIYSVIDLKSLMESFLAMFLYRRFVQFQHEIWEGPLTGFRFFDNRWVPEASIDLRHLL
ncbi:hypothetical protein P3S68_032787 [Capsicum galapagoense]